MKKDSTTNVETPNIGVINISSLYKHFIRDDLDAIRFDRKEEAKVIKSKYPYYDTDNLKVTLSQIRHITVDTYMYGVRQKIRNHLLRIHPYKDLKEEDRTYAVYVTNLCLVHHPERLLRIESTLKNIKS